MPKPYILKNVPGKVSFSQNPVLSQSCQLPQCVIPFYPHNLVQFRLITIIFSSKLRQGTHVGCYMAIAFPPKWPSLKGWCLLLYTVVFMVWNWRHYMSKAPEDFSGSFACLRTWGWPTFVYKAFQSIGIQRTTAYKHKIMTVRQYHHEINYNVTALKSVFNTNQLYQTNTEVIDCWSWLRDLNAQLLLIWVGMRDLNSLNSL